MSDDLSCRVDEDEEIIVKAMTDYWVVGKKSDQRELYVILNQKNANLIEVNGMYTSRNLYYILVIYALINVLFFLFIVYINFFFCRGGEQRLSPKLYNFSTHNSPCPL